MLTEHQLKQYNRDGYILVSGIFTNAELDEMESALDGIIDRRLKQQPDMNVTWAGEWKKEMPATKLLHTHDVQAYSAVWSRVLVHDRFTGTLADINRSQRTRKTVLIQFRDPADPPLLDTHRSHAQGMILRGIDPLEAQAAAAPAPAVQATM